MVEDLRTRVKATFGRLASLRVRLTLTVGVLSLLALSSGALLLVWTVESTVLGGIRRSNADELDHFRTQIERGVAPDALELPRGFVRVGPPPGLHQVWGSPGVPAPSLLPPPPPLPGFATAPLSSSFARGPGFGVGTARAWSVLERSAQSPREGPFVIAVGRPLLEARRSVETLTRVLLVGVPALVALSTLAAWVLIGRTLRPVHAMSRSAARIADATTPDRLGVPPTRDEVAELAVTLNGMLDRLGASARRQREFVSDASHELRSPIATLRTLLEVGLLHPERSEPQALHAALLAETLRLETLASDMLVLARLDETRAPGQDEVDLDDVVLEEAARARRVPIDTRAVTAAKLRGDRHHLLHLVRNLLDNAARYATSHVTVTTRADAEGVVLWVDDDGPGIREQDRTRIFERFTRSGADRSRETGGAGLGLAVVGRVAEQHGAMARALASPAGGARLEVRFACP
jgi:signal transduction histidine kinase